MAFDGIFTHAMVNELTSELLSGRISKIYQPYAGELVLTIRVNRTNKTLLLSTNPNYARVQITKQQLSNPSTPSNFTMSLRKHLEGAIVKDINQFENDRIINLSFSHRNDLGDEEDLILAVEIMGRLSNIVLYESKSLRIIDTIKHISSDQNRYRMLVPGATYRLPPAQEKVNFFESKSDKIKDLQNQFPNYEVLGKELQRAFQGFNHETAVELAYELINANDTSEIIQNFKEQLSSPHGYIYKTDTDALKYSAIRPTLFDPAEQFDSLSELLDQFYLQKVRQDRVSQRGHELIRVVTNELKKNIRKKKKLEKTLAQTEFADEYRIKGEILTTYLSQIERGMTEITLPNFYDNNEPIKISLSNQLSPSKNAQKYFTKYQKQKNAVKYVNEQLDLTNQEIAFLDNLQTQIDLAEPEDLDEIKIELQEEGYLKVQKKSKRPSKPIKSQPEHFKASDGTDILVGKNDTQNDRLSLKTAAKNHYWFHAKDIPGSHVIVESEHPSEETLTEAATIAAYYSKAKNSSNVAVDYVQVKKLRKPNKAKPGFVIYEGQKTLRVTPEIELINKLKNNA